VFDTIFDPQAFGAYLVKASEPACWCSCGCTNGNGCGAGQGAGGEVVVVGPGCS
jgi:hypothetical protein